MKRMSDETNEYRACAPFEIRVCVTMPLMYARPTTPLKLVMDEGSASIGSRNAVGLGP
jgi:hypothetical protein